MTLTSTRTQPRRPSSTPSPPWRAGETHVVLLAAAVALVLLAVCWFQASGSGEPSDQLPWLNFAAAGVLTYWALAGRTVARARRRVAQRRATAFAALTTPTWGGTSGGTSDGTSADTADLRDEAVEGAALVSAPGMTRAHRPHCPLVAGKPTGPARAGAPLCGVCG